MVRGLRNPPILYNCIRNIAGQTKGRLDTDTSEWECLPHRRCSTSCIGFRVERHKVHRDIGSRIHLNRYLLLPPFTKNRK
jgi:hypothetical protein